MTKYIISMVNDIIWNLINQGILHPQQVQLPDNTFKTVVTLEKAHFTKFMIDFIEEKMEVK
jgi:hypothetical protein